MQIICKINKTVGFRKEPLIHPTQLFFRALQPVADAFMRHLAGETGQREDDLALGHHNEEERDECEKAEGADDVEGVFGRGVETPPGDGAGQPVRFEDVLAPAEQREAGPDGSHQPDETARSLDVGSSYPLSCEERATLTYTAAHCTGSATVIILHLNKMSTHFHPFATSQ